MSTFNPKKVVLAYSGGLDTSIILKWLQTEYGCEVVTFTADLGQGEELEPARQKAILMGIKPENIHIVDVREEFVRDFVFPMFRANALYEGLYLLGTSIARPLISQHLVRIAHETGADAVAHGATGKGNDQVRFELSAAALDPAIKVIAPWRLWDLTSRTKLLEFAEANQIPIAKDKRGEAPFSVDANLLHTSSEGKVLENPAEEAPEFVYQRTVSPEEAPDQAEMVEITFEAGDAVAINGVAMSPATILTKLNEIGGKHGVGRLDLVENRFVGMKSRGVYETPGGTILLEAHRGIEQITLDSGAGHLKDSIMPRYAELIYNGFWFSPEREMLQALIDKSQERVSGTVRVKLYKGSARTVARWSAYSLYSEKHVTFEEDAGAYDQKDAQGFITLNGLRLKLLAARNARVKCPRPLSFDGKLCQLFIMRHGGIGQLLELGQQIGQRAFGVIKPRRLMHGVIPMRRPNAVKGLGACGPFQHGFGEGNIQRSTELGKRIAWVCADVETIDHQRGGTLPLGDLVKEFGLLDKAKVRQSGAFALFGITRHHPRGVAD